MPRPNLPETMICSETGRVLRRDVRPFTFSYKGLTRTVDLPGYYPDGEGESVHVGDDMAPTDAALAEMKAIADGPAAAAAGE
jgi:HTH-type transcriptional regulator/antitoxin MqsA